MIHTNERFTIEWLDSSRLSDLGRCEARFLFRDLMGLRLPDADMLALDYGTVMHRILPLMYSGSIEEPCALWDRLWPQFPYGEENAARNSAVTRLRIDEFVRSHTPENCPYEIVHFPFSSPAELISENEVPFLIDIGALYPLCGRIDAMVRWKSTKKLWAYDFKTSSEISDRYFEGFWLCPQSCTYTLAACQLTGEKVEGMIYEAMRISAAKKPTLESTPGFSYVTEQNLRTFIEETKISCARIEAANSSGCWRQNHALCSTYSCFGYPSRVCEYKLICDSPRWEDGARFFRREKPFNPLEMEQTK